VAANVVATVCGVSIPVAVLAQQVIVDGSETICESDVGDITIEQVTGGQNAAPTGGNNSRQEGLVNVSLGDVEILNNVNVAVAANVLVTVCGLDVTAAVLAVQGVGDAGQTFCSTTEGPIFIDQA
ncbi:MAG TPA: hypothetical protein VFB61_13545, partial [Gemmatimonadales bacterium]|nr:hypothetical protein [Gemmatimonadales bacterium]